MIINKQSLIGKISQNKQSLKGKVNYKEKSDYNLQEKEVNPTSQIQDVVADEDYDGLSKVVVNAIAVQEKTAKATTTQQEVLPDSNYVLSKVTISPIINQEKSVTPTKQNQTITADQNYDGLSQVNVGAIPNNYIDTTDADATSINIRDSKTAYVNGTKITGTLPVLTYPVNPSNPQDYSYQFIAATSASKVVRDGTTYVMGAYQVATEQQPDSWMFEGNRKMKLGIPQNKVATAINLQSSQIKSGQTVLGVAGATQGELSVTENGQYNVVNYDSVNVNVSSGGGKWVLPDKLRFTDSGATDWSFLKNVDTSNMTVMYKMFYGCLSATSMDVSSFDISNVYTMSYMFSSCQNLVDLNVDCFNIEHLSANANRVDGMFSQCYDLSNDSLNNILKMLSTWTKTFTNKNLRKLSLSQAQCETCTTLSNWQACVDVGWSTGY